MTQIGELAMMGMITEHVAKCELCREPVKPPTLKSNADAKWEDDPGEAIGNDSGDLESAMAAEGSPRPMDWKISGTIGPVTVTDHVVKPNPHHLIPGNESLKRSDILPWIFASDEIEADIGYDVNNALNGVWLPSNNAMRSNAAPPRPTKWSNDKTKKDYVILAMDKSGGHFHDRHVDYSDFVAKVLNKMADRMLGLPFMNMDCPYVTQPAPSGKAKPPYFLYIRLNGVSQRLATHLAATAPQQRFLFTSELVKLYWKAKNAPHLQGSPT